MFYLNILGKIYIMMYLIQDVLQELLHIQT